MYSFILQRVVQQTNASYVLWMVAYNTLQVSIAAPVALVVSCLRQVPHVCVPHSLLPCAASI